MAEDLFHKMGLDFLSHFCVKSLLLINRFLRFTCTIGRSLERERVNRFIKYINISININVSNYLKISLKKINK